MPEPLPQLAAKSEPRDASPMSPREIVSELDRYIVGQKNAKRAVAIALRNRWRRQQVSDELRDEIAPKNIIMIGPTGVGKTEISRRLAKLAQAPFLKVEASKFTEVGYVGRDVESMIRDLTELAINMVKEEEKEKVQIRARESAEEKVLDLLLPPRHLGFPDARGPDHDDVLRRDLVAELGRNVLPPPPIAQRDRHGALGLLLADDVAIELGDDLGRRQGVGHGGLTAFRR